MDDPVKLSILKAFEAAVSGVSSVRQVTRDIDTMTIDRETARFPLVFIHDEIDRMKTQNRIEIGNFEIYLEVWTEKGTISVADQAELIRADIKKGLRANSSIKSLVMKLREQSAEPFSIGKGLGGIVIIYQVDYGHKDGDPYDPAKN